MIEAEQLATQILLNQNEIINAIESKSVQLYSKLCEMLKNSDIKRNVEFQKIYRYFYILNRGGLTEEFIQHYFVRLQEAKENIPTLESLIRDFYTYDRQNNKPSVQFSFSTKLLHMVDHNYPIYDNLVEKVFGYKSLYVQYKMTFDDKVLECTKRIKYIQSVYYELISSNQIESILEAFDRKFFGNDLGVMKKVDFVVWTYGRLLQNNTIKIEGVTKLGRNTNSKEELINLIKHYISELSYAHAAFETYYLLKFGPKKTEKAFAISPVFFSLVRKSLFSESILTLCKFMEGHKNSNRSDLNLNSFIDKLKNNDYILNALNGKEKKEIIASYDKHQIQILKYQPLIDKLLYWRDKMIAHFDKIFSDGPYKAVEVSAEDIRKLMDFIADLLYFYANKIGIDEKLSYKYYSGT
jgi:hypothetical protein